MTSSAQIVGIAADVALTVPADILGRMHAPHIDVSWVGPAVIVELGRSGITSDRLILAQRASIVGLAELLLSQSWSVVGDERRNPQDDAQLTTLECLVQERLAASPSSLPLSVTQEIEPIKQSVLELARPMPSERPVEQSDPADENARRAITMLAVTHPAGLANAIVYTAVALFWSLPRQPIPISGARHELLLMAAAGGCLIPSVKHLAMRRMARDLIVRAQQPSGANRL